MTACSPQARTISTGSGARLLVTDADVWVSMGEPAESWDQRIPSRSPTR